ncbi:hypothetical protein YPPY01_4489, partial [Yersinia pestis PY-01]|jgi:hypothetical protein
MAIA